MLGLGSLGLTHIRTSRDRPVSKDQRQASTGYASNYRTLPAGQAPCQAIEGPSHRQLWQEAGDRRRTRQVAGDRRRTRQRATPPIGAAVCKVWRNEHVEAAIGAEDAAGRHKVGALEGRRQLVTWLAEARQAVEEEGEDAEQGMQPVPFHHGQFRCWMSLRVNLLKFHLRKIKPVIWRNQQPRRKRGCDVAYARKTTSRTNVCYCEGQNQRLPFVGWLGMALVSFISRLRGQLLFLHRRRSWLRLWCVLWKERCLRSC